jgi:hypothetical protein
MRKSNIGITGLALVFPFLFLSPPGARGQVDKAPYAAMAPLDQY